MRIVTLDQIKDVIDHRVAYDAVVEALTAIGAGQMESPEELAFKLRSGGEIHIKGGHLTDDSTERSWIVFKVASGSFPAGGNAGCSVLLDGRTGEPSVLLDDGGWLTEMRTAAAGAVAAELLAGPGPLTVAILGTGVQARFQLAALRSRTPPAEVRVWGRTPERALAYAEENEAMACGSVDEAVDGADLIVTTTSSTEPILAGRSLARRVHITAMGADMIGKRELGAEVLDLASLVVADDVMTCSRVGELQHSPDHTTRAVALADVLAGRAGADRATGVTVADLCGLGAYDTAIAGAVMANLGR